jgi:hypothetical protein
MEVQSLGLIDGSKSQKFDEKAFDDSLKEYNQTHGNSGSPRFGGWIAAILIVISLFFLRKSDKAN